MQVSNVTSSIPHRLFKLERVRYLLVYWGFPAANRWTSSYGCQWIDAHRTISQRNGGSADPLRAREQIGFASVCGPTHPLIVDFNHGPGGSYGEVVEVQKDVALRVEEIVFRYQQAQAAQDAALQSYIAHARIEQHFHPSAADAAYNIITENRLFWARDGLEWEELSFEMNGAKWTAHRPAFPLVQPEKVLSLPLDLRLDQDYTTDLTVSM